MFDSGHFSQPMIAQLVTMSSRSKRGEGGAEEVGVSTAGDASPPVSPPSTNIGSSGGSPGEKTRLIISFLPWKNSLCNERMYYSLQCLIRVSQAHDSSISTKQSHETAHQVLPPAKLHVTHLLFQFHFLFLQLATEGTILRCGRIQFC